VLREGGEQRPIERLVAKLVVDTLDIGVGNGVVADPDACLMVRRSVAA
jgi:hypothetical protein